MHRKIMIIVVAALLTFVGTETASAQSVAVDDPIGDQAKSPNAQNLGSEPYFDIVRAEVSKDSGTFSMTMRLAAPIPVTPPNPNGHSGSSLWLFAVDTQDGAIVGYPFPPGPGVGARPFEYFIQLSWDGTELFTAFVIDRTPLASGGEAINTFIPFSFNPARDELTLEVDPALIGNPTAFSWIAVTAVRESHPGTEGVQARDVAPGLPFPN